MDHYNFHVIGGMEGTPTPYMCALLCNLIAASAAGLAFHLLWCWQNSGDRAYRSAHIRAAWVVLPPVALVYLGVVVFSNASIWIQLAVLMPIAAANFIALLVIRDPTIKPSESDRRIIFVTVVIVMVIFTALGIAVAAAIYLLPHVPTVLPDHNLIRSWELDLERARIHTPRSAGSGQPGLSVARHLPVYLYVFRGRRPFHSRDLSDGQR